MAQSPFLHAGPSDVTLDQSSNSSGPLAQPAQRIALIKGSGPHLTQETADVLRNRLRTAAMCLFIGLATFAVWYLIRGYPKGPLGTLLFYHHMITVAILAVPLIGLCRRCPVPMVKLRIFEFVIFASSLALFSTIQYARLVEGATKGFIPLINGAWYALLLIYAMFIPSSWKRTALVLSQMALVPLCVILYCAWTNERFGQLLSQEPSYLVEMALFMAITVFTGAVGSHTINTLRHEAFQARQLGQYKLCRPLGVGGMGEVYLAEHQMMKRPCAIKVIRPSNAQNPQALARFEREVRATAKLTHWNTVEIFDYGRTDDGTFYYVMEYLPGLSLAELVERHGPLSPARVIHLLRQTCDALTEAHRAGLIHRDIKPGNIFAAERGGVYDVAKLLDFGLAKPIVEQASIQLTQDGSIAGSPLFMAPEQATGDQAPDARSDIYSLGGVAYYLLTGAPPFPGEKAIKVIMAHANEEVIPPSRHRAEIPSDLEQVVLRCLAKNPEDRYQSTSELSEALAECAAAEEWTREHAAEWWQANAKGALELCPKEAAAAVS